MYISHREERIEQVQQVGRCTKICLSSILRRAGCHQALQSDSGLDLIELVKRVYKVQNVNQ